MKRRTELGAGMAGWKERAGLARGLEWAMRVWVAVGLGTLGGGALGAAAVDSGDVVSVPKLSYGLGELRVVAMSPDRLRVVSAGQSGAFLWDATAGRVLHRWEMPGGRVTAAIFTPDGGSVITGGADGVVREWGVATGEPGRVYVAHAGEVTGLACSADGRWLVTASSDNWARVWARDSGQLVRGVRVPGSPLQAVAITGDGTRVVTADASFTNNVAIWSVATGERLRVLGEHSGAVRALAFLRDGRLATGGEDRRVHVWDAVSGRRERTLVGADDVMARLVAPEQGPDLVAGCYSGQVLAWDVDTGAVVSELRRDRLLSMDVASDGSAVVLGTVEFDLELLDYPSGSVRGVWAGHTTSTTVGVAFSPDGRHVLSGGVERRIRLWNRTNGEPAGSFPGGGGGTQAATFSPDGSRVLTTLLHPRKVAQIWRVETGLLERELVGHSGYLSAADFSADGARVVTASWDGTVRVWDVETGAAVRIYAGLAGGAMAGAISADGRWVAGGGGAFDPQVLVWDAGTGEVVQRFWEEAGSVRSLGFSRSGRELLVAWDGGLVRIFAVATGELIRELVVPAAFLNAAVWSPDGELLLTAESFPGFVARLWEVRTGRLLRTFAGHAWQVGAVAFNRAGTEILTGGDNVRRWSIADVAARLRFQRGPAGLELRWSHGGLQRADAVDGPWHPVPQAASPWVVPLGGERGFFRVEAPAED